MSGYEENSKASFYDQSAESGFITYDDGRDRTLSSREAERRKLEEDMKQFLGGGGEIHQIDRNVRMDPPRKPTSNYGSRPI